MQVTIEPARYLCSESCATLCALYITCRPSKKRTVREVWRACSSLWVTMTMVRPSSLFNLWSNSMTSAPILESRLPGRFVGKDDVGIADDGTGDGDTLALAAGELAGVCLRLVLQSHLAKQVVRLADYLL